MPCMQLASCCTSCLHDQGNVLQVAELPVGADAQARASVNVLNRCTRTQMSHTSTFAKCVSTERGGVTCFALTAYCAPLLHTAAHGYIN